MADALAGGLDRPRTLVAEQNRQRVVEARANDVQVGVADAARLDPDEDFLGARRRQLDVLERIAPELAQDDAAIHDSSNVRAAVPPLSASVRSVSASSWWTTASTPSCPPTARPYA